MDINLPRSLDTNNSLDFAYMLSAITPTEAVTFYPTFTWARPFGMLLTMAAIKQMRARFIDIPFSMNQELKQGGKYAAYMGFFGAISKELRIGNLPGSVSGKDNYMQITELSMPQLRSESIENGRYEEDGDIIERKARELSKILCQDNIELLNLLTHCIREMIRNVPEHSGVDNIWICGQAWKENGTAEIAVLDEGIGIASSLRKNRFYRDSVTSDDIALKLAVEPGVSKAFAPGHEKSDPSGWRNSGFGLYVLSELCQRLSGSFCIVSGGNYLIKESGLEKTGRTALKGTAVKIKIATHEFNNFKSLNAAIIQDGQKISSKNKMAFKKASHPSRGLMLQNDKNIN